MPYQIAGRSGGGRSVRRTGCHSATIKHYGALVFNIDSIEAHSLTSYSRCVLYFDTDTLAIGIQFLGIGEEHSESRRVYTSCRSAYVMITSLLRDFNIPAHPDVRCPVSSEPDREGCFLRVDIRGAVALEQTDFLLPRPRRGQNLRAARTRWKRSTNA